MDISTVEIPMVINDKEMNQIMERFLVPGWFWLEKATLGITTFFLRKFSNYNFEMASSFQIFQTISDI